MTDAAAYSDMKKLVNTIFPYFDTQALDAARFFFGTTSAEVEIHEGTMNLTDFLQDADSFDEDMNGASMVTVSFPKEAATRPCPALQERSSRNTGYRRSISCFLDEAAKCDPPLSDGELKTIWRSAQKFYSRVASQDGYVPPDVYNDNTSYKPEDFSDVGQAEVLAKHFSNELRYSPATHFIRYTEHYWKETEPGAHTRRSRTHPQTA